MNILKRTLAMLLVLMLTMALFPPLAFAEESVSADNMEETENSTLLPMVDYFLGEFEVVRVSEAKATIAFTCSMNGTYYYQVDGTVPTAASLIASKSNATSIVSMDQVITLTSLEPGEHILYLTADNGIDAHGLEVITIPDYTYDNQISLIDPKATLMGISKEGLAHKVVFQTEGNVPKSSFSHAQGYARYRGNGYDYHIFPYANVAGHYGYLYIASNATDENGEASYSYTLKVPDPPILHEEVDPNSTQEYNPHFNHPCGVQIIGDYLLVAVIPYHNLDLGDYYESAIIYMYDLSPLKGEIPQEPTKYREVMRIPKVNGDSLSCVGIVRKPNGAFELGLIADNNLDVYTSYTGASDIWNAIWDTNVDHRVKLKAGSGKNHYQGMGFLMGQNGEIYLLGFDTRGGLSKNDYADLYQLTKGTIWPNLGETLEPIHQMHLEGSKGARFSYGGGVEVLDENEFVIYSVESYYDNGLWINSFQKSTKAFLPDTPESIDTEAQAPQLNSGGQNIPQTSDSNNPWFFFGLIVVAPMVFSLARWQYSKHL